MVSNSSWHNQSIKQRCRNNKPRIISTNAYMTRSGVPIIEASTRETGIALFQTTMKIFVYITSLVLYRINRYRFHTQYNREVSTAISFLRFISDTKINLSYRWAPFEFNLREISTVEKSGRLRLLNLPAHILNISKFLVVTQKPLIRKHQKNTKRMRWLSCLALKRWR